MFRHSPTTLCTYRGLSRSSAGLSRELENIDRWIGLTCHITQYSGMGEQNRRRHPQRLLKPPLHSTSISREYLPSIFKKPLCTMIMRWPVCNGLPSLYQRMRGVGGPVARHASMATLLTGNVWLAGPIWMIGGGISSTDVTCRKARVVAEPATLSAEQTK